MVSSNGDRSGPNVGILAMEVYTPRTFIRQSELEKHLGVAAGKYTIGLGQEGLALTGDAEDIHSICLTVVHNLLEKYSIDRSRIGRLEVGTETLVDKSKSTKTVLMELFKESGNTDVEGATVVNACYGGTAAFFNAVAWSQAQYYNSCNQDDNDQQQEEQYAIVVAADIATYARGPARPTCGVGAVAMLVGRNAPLELLRDRATHATHAWDFFKPDHTVEYPVVDGALSQICYYQALEDVYVRLVQKIQQQKTNNNNKQQSDIVSVETMADYFCFHAPYNKLVQKSYARLLFLDARRQYQHYQSTKNGPAESAKQPQENGHQQENGHHHPSPDQSDDDQFWNNHPLKQWLDVPLQDTYSDKALEATLKKISADSYKKKLHDANYSSQHIGNTYTASVFFGLASLLDRMGGTLISQNQETTTTIGMFSYGSGALASLYRLQLRDPTSSSSSNDKSFTLERIVSNLQLMKRLESREEVHPSELDHALETRARMHRAGAPYTPVYPTTGRLFPGTYYLAGIDAHWRRSYQRVPMDAPVMALPVKPVSSTEEETELDYHVLAPSVVLRLAQRDALSHPVTGKLQVLVSEEQGESDHLTEARRRVACVITGTAAGLPGGSSTANASTNTTTCPVFTPSNMERLINGEQCIAPVSEEVKHAMLDKNVVQLCKFKDGTTKRVAVDSDEEVIKLAAVLQPFDLSASYGVPPGLAQTMDVAAQIAVAAGLEALKNAGLVSGKSNTPEEWQLPEQFRDRTGVVYASSFPAMDAAVGEVMRFLQSKTVCTATSSRLIAALRSRFLKVSHPEETLSDDDEAAFARLEARAHETQPCRDEKPYEFDRKFLFRVLVLGNAQLAQVAGCRGPNTQTNAACAGTTQAIAMAQDMLISGRADRVVVVAGDNASGDTLLPWLGSGFRALGAACTKAAVEDAALPFDKRRSGLLLGAGGIGMVLETEMSTMERQKLSPWPFEVKARLLHTQYSNSAYHGAALDRKHIGSELQRFLTDIELVHGISKAEIATHGVYFSHETCTHATDASSCSGNEVAALRFAFGEELLSKLLILNTKGFTGHPMGVSFEDVTAVEVLMRQTVPPVPNYQEKDEYLGNLFISKGGSYACRYALRFAAGFGSQVAFALYATARYE